MNVDHGASLEQLFQSLLADYLPLAVLLLDTQGVVRRSNPAAIELFGFRSQAELSGSNLAELVDHPGQERIRHFMEESSVEALNFRIEANCFRHDRTPFWAELVFQKVQYPDEVIHTLVVIQEQPDRRQAEEHLRKLSQAFKQSASGIVITNVKGEIEFVNPAFTTITGYEENEVIGRNLRLLKSGRHPAAFYQDMWSTISRGEVWRGEVVNRKKDGSLYWEAEVISAVRGEDGSITHYVAVKDDISLRKRAEAALLESQQMLSEAQRLAHVGHWIYDLRTRKLSLSDEMYQILGIEPEGFIPSRETLSVLIHEEDVSEFNKQWENLRLERKEFTLEHRIVRPDGDLRFVQERARCTQNEHGEITHFLGTIQDITEIKRRKEADRKFSDQLAQLHEVTMALSAAASIDELSRRAIELGRDILGFDRLGLWYVDLEDPGMLVGSYGIDEDGIVRDERRQRIKIENNSAQDMLIAGRQRIYIRHGYPLRNHRTQIVGHGTVVAAGVWDGHDIIGILNGDNLLRNEEISDRQVELLVLFAQIVGSLATRKRAELALWEKNLQLEALRKIGLELIQQLDLQNVLRSCVSQAARLLDADMGGLYLMRPDKNSLELVVSYNLPTDYTGTVLALGEGFSGRVALSGVTLVSSLNTMRDYHKTEYRDLDVKRVLGVPLKARGQVIGILNIVDVQQADDFTDEQVQLVSLFADQAAIAIENARLFSDAQKAREAAISANQAKSNFLANMSHELRTPLNAILGFTQILRRDPQLAPYQRELTTIQESGQHLLALINDVLDLSRIDVQQLRLQAIDIDLRSLMSQLMEMLRLQASGKGIELVLIIASDIPSTIHADENKLRRVLINLLDNAIKFTDAGKVVLKVQKREKTVESGSGNGESDEYLPALEQLLQSGTTYATGSIAWIEFEVRDTGIGISKENQRIIFEPFMQLSQTGQTREGVGLGLPITGKLIDFMGGEISLESQPGEGSVFRFFIPVIVSDEQKRGHGEIREATSPEVMRLDLPDDALDEGFDKYGSTLPSGWLANFRQALVEGDVEWLNRLISDISVQYPDLSKRLNAMSQNYLYQELFAWTDKASGEP